MSSVTIKLPDGTIAKIINYEWLIEKEGDSPPRLSVLNGLLEPWGASPSDPYPDNTVAIKALAELGGSIISREPPPPTIEGADY